MDLHIEGAAPTDDERAAVDALCRTRLGSPRASPSPAPAPGVGAKVNAILTRSLKTPSIRGSRSADGNFPSDVGVIEAGGSGA